MEGLGKAIVGALFVFLVILAVVLIWFSLASSIAIRNKRVAVPGDREAALPPAETQPAPPEENKTGFWNSLITNLVSSTIGIAPKSEPPPSPPPPPPSPSPSPPPAQPAEGTNQSPPSPPAPSFPPTAIGTSPVVNGKVVQFNGQPVDNSAAAGSSAAPLQSRALAESEYPRGSIVLEMNLGRGITPNRFRVSRGAVVNLVVKSTDDLTHIFQFKSRDLGGIVVGVGPHEARAITFNAPPNGGEYEFQCDIPHHRSLETGVMVVE